MNDFYSALSAHYDDIFPPTPAQQRFVVKRLGMTSRVLEIGAAKGGLTHYLASLGHDATGIDLNPDMITAAIRTSGRLENLRYQVLDMRALSEIFAPESFTAAICVGNTLVHLPDETAIQTTLADIHRILAPEGILMLQIINYDRILAKNLDGLPPIDNERIRFERQYRLNGEFIPLDFETTLVVKSTGETLRQTTRLYPLRSTPLLDLLEAAGFSDLRWYGGFDDAPFDKDTSLQLVVTGRKPPSSKR